MTYLHNFRCCIGMCLLLASFILAPAAVSQSIEPRFKVKDEAQAINRALSYTGFESLRGFSRSDAVKSIQLEILSDSTTPYLADSIAGRPGWTVEFQNIALDMKRVSLKRRNDNPLSFTVSIDAETGRLIEIRSVYTGPADSLPQIVLSTSATNQLKTMSMETYHSLPKSPPENSFVQALDNNLHGTPFSAKLMIAQYIMYSCSGIERIGEEPRPVWIITKYGMPPFNGSITHMRHVIDEKTGELLFESNLPFLDNKTTE